MFDHLSVQLVAGQLLIGLINGSFYAMLSMGLAIIFGLMNVVNFAHGAQYMLGAFAALLLLNGLGISYWVALVVAPVLVALIGLAIERIVLRPLADLDHLYGLLATYSVALVAEGMVRQRYGSSGLPYPNPLPGGINLGFMFLPWYRLWVVALSLIVCLVTWLLIERTRLGSYLRAATEKPQIVESFGINVPRLIALTYAFGAGLAGLGGVLAAPIYQVSPYMGSSIMIVIFAVVVIGGMGSIIGAILTGYLLGLMEAVTKIFYPEGANLVIFVIMIAVLIARPDGIFSGSENTR